MLYVPSHFLDKLVKRFERFGRWIAILEHHLVALEELAPQALQESVYAVDAIGVPWLALFERAEEHLIEAECVGSVALYYVVGVNHIKHRFRHLFHCPSAYIAAVFENKFGVGKLWLPSAEAVDVEHIVSHYVNIHVKRCHIVAVLEACRYKCVGVLDAIHKVAAALYHALVDELLEWLFACAVAVVLEEFVPEAAVNQVACGVLGAADIEVDILPVFACLLRHEGLVVVRVHIAEVVSRTAGKSGHCEEFDREHCHIIDFAVFHHFLVNFVPSPYGGVAEWGFAGLGGQEFVYFGQQ